MVSPVSYTNKTDCHECINQPDLVLIMHGMFAAGRDRNQQSRQMSQETHFWNF
jgi:hypothetical protein